MLVGKSIRTARAGLWKDHEGPGRPYRVTALGLNFFSSGRRGSPGKYDYAGEGGGPMHVKKGASE